MIFSNSLATLAASRGAAPIAWAIAQQLHAQGAEIAFTYVNEAMERRVRPLAESLGAETSTLSGTNAAAELIAFAREHIAGYKLPKSIAFVDDFPRTPRDRKSVV